MSQHRRILLTKPFRLTNLDLDVLRNSEDLLAAYNEAHGTSFSPGLSLAVASATPFGRCPNPVK